MFGIYIYIHMPRSSFQGAEWMMCWGADYTPSLRVQTAPELEDVDINTYTFFAG